MDGDDSESSGPDFAVGPANALRAAARAQELVGKPDSHPLPVSDAPTERVAATRKPPPDRSATEALEPIGALFDAREARR